MFFQLRQNQTANNEYDADDFLCRKFFVDDEIAEDGRENRNEVAIDIGSRGAEFAESKGPKCISDGTAKHTEANEWNDVLANVAKLRRLKSLHYNYEWNEIKHPDDILHPCDSQRLIKFCELDECDGITDSYYYCSRKEKHALWRCGEVHVLVEQHDDHA